MIFRLDGGLGLLGMFGLDLVFLAGEVGAGEDDGEDCSRLTAGILKMMSDRGFRCLGLRSLVSHQ